MILWHGTSEWSGQMIQQEGFRPEKLSNCRDWIYEGNPISKPGFVYLSRAYAPFYAVKAVEEAPFNEGQNVGALIKVEINLNDCYPEDDFLMDHLQTDNLGSICLENYQHLTRQSLKYLGNVAAKPENCKILGVRFFQVTEGLYRVFRKTVDSTIYRIMGQHYKELTERLYKGEKVEEIIQNPPRSAFKKL